jgi:hypothetical protein
MKNSFFSFIALSAFFYVNSHVDSSAQAADVGREEFSSMQWANASALEGVKFTLLGDVVADPWRPGGQTGAGRRDTLTWEAEFAPSTGGGILKEKIELKPGQSGAALLVGDFVEKESGAALTSSTPLPKGFSKTESGKMLRAAVLRFAVGKAKDTQYPVYLVNADPENTVKVAIPGGEYDLKYAVPETFKAPVGESVKIKVSAAGLDREMAFTLEPGTRGGILAFYRLVGSKSTSFVFVNLRSLESVEELIKAQAGG